MNQIAAHRRKARLGQRQLYELLGWSQPRLGNYERGTRTPGLAESRAITAALNKLGVDCSLDDVFPPEPIFDQVA